MIIALWDLLCDPSLMTDNPVAVVLKGWFRTTTDMVREMYAVP